MEGRQGGREEEGRCYRPDVLDKRVRISQSESGAVSVPHRLGERREARCRAAVRHQPAATLRRELLQS